MLKIYPNGMIGYTEACHNQLFSGSDTLENYQKQLKLKGEDWYYKDIEISYIRNSIGHRCIDVSQLDFDNYIMFAGCSYTEGIGLELEKTYPYLLSKKLNCDYYNVAIGGTGIDAIIHNLTVWLNTYKKPKLLIVQWPHLLRSLLIGPVLPDETRELESMSIHDINYNKFLLAGDEIRYFQSIARLTKIKIDSFGLDTYHITRDELNNGNIGIKKSIPFNGGDYARDNHAGIISHAKLSEQLYQQISTKI
jgi:hypothetical protein